MVLRDLLARVRDRETLTDAEYRRLDAAERANRWLAAQSELLYNEWESLPEGSHLKAAYSDRVWTWSDRDLTVD